MRYSSIATGFFLLTAIAPAAIVLPTSYSLSLPARPIGEAIATLQGVGGKGTGTIIEARGIILTSEHVIRFARRGQVSVRTADGETYFGVVRFVDRQRDLALVEILSDRRFATLPLGDARTLAVGQRVYTLEDPFASTALISGRIREIAPDGNLFTDLALSPGDSGSPLLNEAGEIIGVNRAVVRTQDNTSYGLAVNVATVKTFLANLPEAEVASDRPLGIVLSPNSLTIQKIAPESLAARWGLQPGDILVGLNNRPLNSLAQLEALRERTDEALLIIRRRNALTRLRIYF